MSRKGENIRKRKDGRWEGRYIRGRDPNGKAIIGYVYAYSYREAKLKKQQMQNESRNKVAHKRKKCTFNETIDAFLKQEEYKVKLSTFVHYRNIIESHIRPSLGHLNSSILNAVDIENFAYAKLTAGRKDGKGGLSPKSVKDMLSILRLILKYGVDKGLLDFNILNFTMPKVKRRTPQTLTGQEVERLSEKSLKSGENHKFGVYLCLYTGMRIGEICALKWNDIDLENSTVTINKTMMRLYDNTSDIKTKIVIGSPKTESSNRVIPIPEFILKELEKRKKQSKADSYFLTGNEKYIEPRTYYEKYRRFLKECGLKPHSFHCLRHTFATHCAEQGFDPKTLSEILGHSDVRVTLDRYVHPSMEMKRRNMNLLR